VKIADGVKKINKWQRILPRPLALLIRRIYKHDVFGLSAQLAYFFLLSLFPLLITIFSILPFLPIDEEDILVFFEEFAPGETLTLIRNTLAEIMSNHSGGLLSAGIIFTIWSASVGMGAIIRALNRAYEVRETRPFFVVRAMSALLTVVMVFVFFIALLLPVFGKQIGLLLSARFGFTKEFLQAWNTLRWVLSFIILLVVFSALYLLAPSQKIKKVIFFPGALFSTFGWMLTSYGFSYYVGNFGNYTVTYGSLGVIIVLMIWLYLSAIIIMIGGEVNAVYALLKKERRK
jgi:Ribonuclease BN-like family.